MRIISIVIIGLLFFGITGCDNSQSLQKYIVDKQQSAEFISIDIPASIIKLKEENSSDETIVALKSIKKFNILGLKLTEKNKDTYSTEKQTIKHILENKKFKEIFRAKNGKSEVTIKYLGDENNIDEVVFFGADNEKGLALVRVLGENMNPAQMVKLLDKINIDKNGNEFDSLKTLFQNLEE